MMTILVGRRKHFNTRIPVVNTRSLNTKIKKISKKMNQKNLFIIMQKGMKQLMFIKNPFTIILKKEKNKHILIQNQTITTIKIKMKTIPLHQNTITTLMAS